MYDHKTYEDVMFHFNTLTRTTYFEHNVVGEGLDHCFDCASEIYILHQYLMQERSMADEDERNRAIVDLSRDISVECSPKPRSLGGYSTHV
jgi:hypothetical protein